MSLSLVKEVLVDLSDAPGLVIQLSFGISHLTRLKKQLLLQLCDFDLTFLHIHQQLLLTLNEDRTLDRNQV